MFLKKKTLFLNLLLFFLQIFTSSIALDVTQYGAIGDGVTDDSQAFLKAWEAVCSGTGDGKLIVPAGNKFMLQPLKFQGSCKSSPIFVQILGDLVATNKENWKGDKDWWILFTDIEGLVVEGNGVINGQGSSWWEHKDSRPTAMKFMSCNNLRLSGLTHMDSPMAHIHINDCNNVAISNLRINAPESSPNTDGIDIATSSNVVIQDCVIATGDDCIAINSGTSNIHVSGIDCGPGHGISIGSLGKDGETAAVENVCVQNCNFRGTTNGARIKTWQFLKKKTLFLNLLLFFLQIFTSSIALDVIQYGAIGDGVTDDSEAFLKAWEAVCSGTGDEKLIVPAGKKFMLQPLNFQGSCKSSPIFVQILGDLVATNKVNWKGDKDWWILFTDVEGLVVEGNGVINGQGSSWWEHKGSRPTAMKFMSCNNLRLSGLTHMDSPMAHIHINDCNNVAISNLRINAPESSPNTDGIDIATSSNVVIQDCVIATGDDCIAINSGTSNIHVSGIDCGPGHGISIGSLGKDGETAAVENVCVQNCNFRGTTNGARIKTWQGGSGYARMITFHGITLDNVKNPIIIDQFYNAGDSDKGKNQKSSAVQVSKVMYSNFAGTSNSKYAIDFSCSETVPCTEIFLKDVKIEEVSESGQIAPGQCSNVRGASTLAVPGLECLTNNPNMLASSQSPGQTCMSAQTVQPRTKQNQDPIIWVYESRGKRLIGNNVMLISFISLVIYFLCS